MQNVTVNIPTDVLADVVNTLVSRLDDEKRKISLLQDLLNDERFRTYSAQSELKVCQAERIHVEKLLREKEAIGSPGGPTINQVVKAYEEDLDEEFRSSLPEDIADELEWEE